MVWVGWCLCGWVCGKDRETGESSIGVFEFESECCYDQLATSSLLPGLGETPFDRMIGNLGFLSCFVLPDFSSLLLGWGLLKIATRRHEKS